MQLLLDIIICHSIIGVPRHLSKGQCQEGEKWRWCCCCNIIKRLMSGTRRCMSILLCSLFPSIHSPHQYNINTLHFDLATCPLLSKHRINVSGAELELEYEL